MRNIQKKFIGLVVVIAVIVGALSFYAGMKYKTKTATNVDQTQGISMMRQGFRNGGRGSMGGFSGGTVVSIDATSMTVQGRDGSSKIVFFTQATPVMKMVAGKVEDIVVGSDITVVGTPNPDGSITSESIQIRPLGMMQGRNQKTN